MIRCLLNKNDVKLINLIRPNKGLKNTQLFMTFELYTGNFLNTTEISIIFIIVTNIF